MKLFAGMPLRGCACPVFNEVTVFDTSLYAEVDKTARRQNLHLYTILHVTSQRGSHVTLKGTILLTMQCTMFSSQ